MFINFYACVDEYRRDDGEGFLDSSNILFNLRNEIDNDVNEIARLFIRRCRDKDLDNAIVIIGALLFFYFEAKRDEPASWPMHRGLIGDLKSLNLTLYKKCLTAFFRNKDKVLNNFKKLILDYDASDKYLSDTLLHPQTALQEMRERNLAPEQEETRRKLREILADNLGLCEEDKEELLQGVYQLVESGSVGEPGREIATGANQHKICHFLYKMYKQTDAERKLWLELIRNYFKAKFQGTSESTLSKSFRCYAKYDDCDRRAA